MGVGLGLSICKEIILSQGGSIDIKSEVGKGTDFIVNLQAKCLVDNKRLSEAKDRMEALGHYESSESSENSFKGNEGEEDYGNSSEGSKFSRLFSYEDKQTENNIFSDVVLKDKSTLKVKLA